MYQEIERRRQPQAWVIRNRPTGKIPAHAPESPLQQPAAATAQPARRADDGFPLSWPETQGLLNKLQALTEANGELEAFNATVSHDLCTPLTTINGYCQVLTETCGDQLDESAREYLHGIYQGTLRMKALISSMLEFSRATRTAALRESIDLSEMAHLVGRELKIAAPRRGVTLRIAKEMAVHGDPGLWRSVLDNLIGNAWKHGAGQEKLTISVGQVKLAGRPAYFVRDNGPGFDMALADRLFLPFQRAAGTGTAGHGIGLATVDRIVRRGGGRVWVESKPGKGASFYFTME
jgi:signal transduction histidine kinase